MSWQRSFFVASLICLVSVPDLMADPQYTTITPGSGTIEATIRFGLGGIYDVPGVYEVMGTYPDPSTGTFHYVGSDSAVLNYATGASDLQPIAVSAVGSGFYTTGTSTKQSVGASVGAGGGIDGDSKVTVQAGAVPVGDDGFSGFAILMATCGGFNTVSSGYSKVGTWEFYLSQDVNGTYAGFVSGFDGVSPVFHQHNAPGAFVLPYYASSIVPAVDLEAEGDTGHTDLQFGENFDGTYLAKSTLFSYDPPGSDSSDLSRMVSTLSATVPDAASMMQLADIVTILMPDPTQGGLTPDGVSYADWNGDGFLTFDDLTTLIEGVGGDLLGDLNFDYKVDQKDYEIWLQNSGLPHAFGYTSGDINGDGVVDAADYEIMMANFGRSITPPSSFMASSVDSNAIPEASPLMLLSVVAICFAAFSIVRGRHRIVS